MSNFGKILKELRREKQISQQKLAQILHLSQSTIAYYELGKKQPNQNTLQEIADFFGVTTDYLLGRTSYRTNMVCEKKPTFYNVKNEVSPIELEKIIRDSNVIFDGILLDEEDKEYVVEFVKMALHTLKKYKHDR